MRTRIEKKYFVDLNKFRTLKLISIISSTNMDRFCRLLLLKTLSRRETIIAFSWSEFARPATLHSTPASYICDRRISHASRDKSFGYLSSDVTFSSITCLPRRGAGDIIVNHKLHRVFLLNAAC